MSKITSIQRTFIFTALLGLVFLIITSCQDGIGTISTPEEVNIPSGYEYQLGLGYGFLDKKVQVWIDGDEILSLVGTEEIETFAQMQGTYMLASGSSPHNDVTVRIAINGDQLHEQTLDLSTGTYLHIYLENSGLNIYNTAQLILE